jgi:hypothetical protein
MSTTSSSTRLTIPPSLKEQLGAFRKRVWTTKMIEFVAMATAGLFLAYAAVFIAERIWDTPWQIRTAIFLGVIAIWCMVPYAFHRWVWGHRKLEQVARLLRKREPNIGDQLLGVIELATSDSEQARSPALCAAAMRQVAESAQGRDLTKAAPPSRYRNWSIAASALFALVATTLVVVPEAATNSWLRFFAPWSDTPRYTFAQLENLPNRWVVPHGEEVPLQLKLNPASRWQPARAQASIPYHPPLTAELQNDQYQLNMPPLTDSTSMHLRVGDLTHKMEVVPKLRPEISSMSASIQLPEYLQIKTPLQREVRSGTIQAVIGSSVKVEASVSQPLTSAKVDSQAVEAKDNKFVTPVKLVSEGANPGFTMEWVDTDRLSNREPLTLKVEGLADEQPSLNVEGLLRQLVVLDSEQLNFDLSAMDDFGVKRVGLEWKGMESALVEKPAQGELVLAAGGPENSTMKLNAVFTAKDNNIEPQPIELRVWVEDYLPNRPRVYSAPHMLYVLSPEQHAIWVTEQLNRWHRQALEVRDRETQLNQTNKRLREMTMDELNTDEMRKQLESQAAAEQANARRLTQLGQSGQQLLKQAARNSEIGVGHLDKWAEMLSILNDISANRMPSVSDLLDKASKNAPGENESLAQNKSSEMAGQIRDTSSGAGSGKEEKKDQPPPPSVPALVDAESSQQPKDNKPDDGEAGSKSNKQGRFTLPTTTVAGSGKSQPQNQQEAMQEAVKQQDELLAEFQKLADDMSELLGNLEGSTLVKRLKAASREQLQVANRIGDRIPSTFGVRTGFADEDKTALNELTKVEAKSADTLSSIMDDMQAYFDRRPLKKFKVVLDEMKEFDVLSGVRSLADDIPKEQGLSIAQAEFWSDNLDRWADDLVDPASKGSCPGSKSRDSLPPSIVLEVLQILEAEVNLREETRVAEQSKKGVEEKAFAESVDKLGDKQGGLADRVEKVIGRIEQLPEAQVHFEKEMQLLAQVTDVMQQAEDLLYTHETGAITIAAETEAIELLLQSKKINPKARGGGGGSSPGGGGEGTTSDLALALSGAGTNEKEDREYRETQSTTGETGAQLPEEFRSGLDQYFNTLEKQSGN